MPKLSQKNIFLISGIAIFLVITTLLAFYFNSQNSQNKIPLLSVAGERGRNDQSGGNAVDEVVSTSSSNLSVSNSQNEIKDFDTEFHFPGPMADMNNKMPWSFVNQDNFDDSFNLIGFSSDGRKGLTMDVNFWGEMQEKFKPDMGMDNPTRKLRIQGKYNKNNEIIEVTKMENVFENSSNSSQNSNFQSSNNSTNSTILSNNLNNANQETEIENKEMYIKKFGEKEFDLYEKELCLQNSVGCNVYNLNLAYVNGYMEQDWNLDNTKVRINGKFKKVSNDQNDKKYMFTSFGNMEDANKNPIIKVENETFYFQNPGQSGIFLWKNKECLVKMPCDSAFYDVSQKNVSKFASIPLDQKINQNIISTIQFGSAKVSGTMRKTEGGNFQFIEIIKVEK